MTKLSLSYIIAIVLLCLVVATYALSCKSIQIPVTASPYSYSTWYSLHGNKPSPPMCTLTGNNGTCLETGKAPSEDQFIAWESYSIWLDCTQFEEVTACKQLMN